MIDPLAEVVTLLQPGAPFTKAVGGAGRWGVRRSEPGDSVYCVILAGSCRLGVDGHTPITLQADDFILIPSTYGFTMSSLEPATADDFNAGPVELLDGGFRLGAQNGPPDVQFLVGHFVFGSADAALLISLLPQLVHVRGERRLATLVQLVGDEARAMRSAREVVLARLLEVLLIEALRSDAAPAASPGLLRGLADSCVSVAIRRMHESPTRSWTVAELAQESALSRSAFFERFNRAVGVSPMEYLLAWRMALAKNLLLRNQYGVAEIAERVGYSSAATFSVAFTRHVGQPPTAYARDRIASVP